MSRRCVPLLFCALGCVPDYAEPADKAGGDADSGAASSGSDGTDGTDGTDGADGPPAWVGDHELAFTIDTPRGDLLCSGSLTLSLEGTGSGAGAGPCEMLVGPGEGETADLTLDLVVDDPSLPSSDASGEATLALAGGPGGGDGPGPGALWGTVSEDGIELSFEITGVGPDGDGALTGALSGP